MKEQTIETMYESFVNYAYSLMFGGDRDKARDVVHDCVLEVLSKNKPTPTRYVMFLIRKRVWEYDKHNVPSGVAGKDYGWYHNYNPHLEEKVDQDIMIGSLRVYKRGGIDKQQVSPDKTKLLQDIMKMTVDKYTPQEIADKHGISKHSVWDYQYKGRKQLKAQL